MTTGRTAEEDSYLIRQQLIGQLLTGNRVFLSEKMGKRTEGTQEEGDFIFGLLNQQLTIIGEPELTDYEYELLAHSQQKFKDVVLKMQNFPK